MMELTVSEDACTWYKDELDIEDGSYIRFHVRYGGNGLIAGFSLGVNTDTPQLIHTSTEVNKITFFIEQSDAWYFEDKNLKVTLDERNSEPQYSYD